MPDLRSSTAVGGPAGVHPLAGLIRRFVVDWLNRADVAACREIMDPGYVATVGGVALAGLDGAYLPATLGQLTRFPGLLVTVHELWLGESRAALRFSEHGPAIERGGAPAAWAGIGLFDWDGTRLTANVTEEDYLSRRRQLAEGVADPVATPAAAPWAAVPSASDEDAEQAVRRWLVSEPPAGEASAVLVDDGWTGQPVPPLLDVDSVVVDSIFSSGRRVAFHAVQTGRYTGGLDVPVGPGDHRVDLRICGMVTVDADHRIAGHVVRDRVGLRRELVAGTAEVTGA